MRTREHRMAAILIAFGLTNLWQAPAWPGQPAVADAPRRLTGRGDETAALARLLAETPHVTIPGGLTVTISDSVALPPDATVEGPGTIHLAGRSASLRLAERCTIRDVRFTCAAQFAHGSAITAATTQPGTVRRMDGRIVGCSFQKMHGQALLGEEVSHVSFESNRWENHSDASKFYDAICLRAVRDCKIRGNTILHPNQGILFHGGTHNIVSDNYVENCLQGITCHTQAGHPAHWPYTLFAHNTITGNVIRRFREEGICYDNSMGETPAAKAAQNQVRCIATLASATAGDGRIRVTLAEPPNSGKSYKPGWADGYYVGVLTGEAAATLLQVIASGVDNGAGWIDLPRIGNDLHERLAKGDTLWIAAGCFLNTISANTLDNEGMVSGTGNATAIGLWGAAWHNRIIGNACSTRQYGITIGCVGLAPPDSPQGPSCGNDISHNAIAATWANDKPRPEEKSAGIGFVYIGEGPRLGGRLFLANSITHNTISWSGPRPISLARDTGTVVAFNRITDARAGIWLDHTTDAVIEGNRSGSGALITRVEQAGPCSFRTPRAQDQQ